MSGPKVDAAEVQRIAHLAKLRLQPEELEALACDISALLGYIAVLNEAQDDNPPPESPRPKPGGLSGQEPAPRLRRDEPRPSLPHAEAMAQAPETENGAFLVPKVIG